MSKKDETSRLIERMVDRINQTSSAGFFDDATSGFGGNFNLYGVLAFVFTRSALQLHANSGVRDRKLPTLRTYAEKYIRMMPDLVRADGLGWAFGRAAGAYGQMHCISLILQGLRDGWIPDDQKAKYFDILRRLFLFFYQTYLDQEHGFLDLRDDERTAYSHHTTRMANFDAARYLCQWSRLAKTVQLPAGNPKIEPPRTSGRFVIFRQEQPQGTGPVPVSRRRDRPAPADAAHQLRRQPLERRADVPALPGHLRLAEQRISADHASRADLRRTRSRSRRSTGRTASPASACGTVSISATNSPS